MKKIILIPAILLFTISIYSQTNWPPIGAQWYYSYTPCDIDYCPNIDEFIYFEVVKDTIVNDTACKKIIVEHHNIDNNIEQLGYELIYATEDQVYNYHHGHFHLLYDYSLKVGDTVDLYLDANSNLYVKLGTDVVPDTTSKLHVVIEIDSVEINSMKHFAMSLEPIENVSAWSRFFDGSVIKGIGSTSFLMGQIASTIEFDYYGPLRCFHDSSTNYETVNACDTLITKSKEVSVDKQGIKLYPCPSKNRIRVVYDAMDISGLLYQIFDNTGKVLLNGFIQPDHIIDVSSLASGIYYLKIVGDDNDLRGRFVKQ